LNEKPVEESFTINQIISTPSAKGEQAKPNES